MADKLNMMDRYNPPAVAALISTKMKKLRIGKNMTQSVLAARSGVSLGSLKRFETTHQVSLQSLLKLAVVLDAIEPFQQLFDKNEYESIDQLIKDVTKNRKRARRV